MTRWIFEEAQMKELQMPNYGGRLNWRIELSFPLTKDSCP